MKNTFLIGFVLLSFFLFGCSNPVAQATYQTELETYLVKAGLDPQHHLIMDVIYHVSDDDTNIRVVDIHTRDTYLLYIDGNALKGKSLYSVASAEDVSQLMFCAEKYQLNAPPQAIIRNATEHDTPIRRLGFLALDGDDCRDSWMVDSKNAVMWANVQTGKIESVRFWSELGK